jgi:hypothetical protein
MASVCASKDAGPGRGYLQYRFGKLDGSEPLEQTLPEGQVVPAKAATGENVPFAGGGGAWHVYVTGHSLGGALATLAAYDASATTFKSGTVSALTLYNFGSPRVGNGVFAAVARWIERDFLANTMATRSPNAPLAQWLDFAELARELPASTALPETYTRVFPGMALARVRREFTSATIYGGSDAPTGLGLGSGLATNPTFFKFRKGAAVLESVRMTPAFFSTGFFYSNGLHAAEGRYQLQQTVNVPYHLPLPAAYRNEQGDYKKPDQAQANFFVAVG